MRRKPISLILFWIVYIDAQLILWNSETRREKSTVASDCLYYSDKRSSINMIGTAVWKYHLFPFCRRSELQDSIDVLPDETGNKFSFDDLDKLGVNTEQLLNWLIPIDIIDRYEQNRGTSSTEVLYNCSSPWFGSHCQYRFGTEVRPLFKDVVHDTFRMRTKPCRGSEQYACYPFLPTCDRGLPPLCLDWREICDGKRDCADGEDEQNCEVLQTHECLSDEYRCHFGGQCIPKVFLRDGESNLDCLDGSDEIELISYQTMLSLDYGCAKIILFHCEERMCRYPYSFSCGDGECTQLVATGSKIFPCRNDRSFRSFMTLIDSTEECQKILLCLLRIPMIKPNECIEVWSTSIRPCESLSSKCHSPFVALGKQPILFGFFQFIYWTNRSIDEFRHDIFPDLICFNEQYCPSLYTFLNLTDIGNGLPCSRRQDLPDNVGKQTVNRIFALEVIVQPLIQRCLTIGRDESCSDPSLFHCKQSKRCISRHRLLDSVPDCFFGEDESYPACTLNDTSRFVCKSDPSKCLSTVALVNFNIHCPNEPLDFPELYPYVDESKERYLTFCDNQNDGPFINDQSVDEQDCELWPCETPYTRCNQHWDCWNGIDEIGCSNHPCGSNEHRCNSLVNSSEIICLPLAHFYDRIIDDCTSQNRPRYRRYYFENRTDFDPNKSIAWNTKRCINPENLCTWTASYTGNKNDTICKIFRLLSFPSPTRISTIDDSSLCEVLSPLEVKKRNFNVFNLGFTPSIANPPSSDPFPTESTFTPTRYTVDYELNVYCYRGIYVHFGPNLERRCFCPPSTFGERCQWQSQRISLTLQFIFRTFQASTRVFQLILMLVDEDGFIAPHSEQITYVPTIDCLTKYNIYLLYPDRPKLTSKTYSVRIEMYDRIAMKYYTSWQLDIPFPFLPVNRLAARLIIPDEPIPDYCPLNCGLHGQCQRYSNNRTLFFCLCDQGYSGLTCNQSFSCSCHKDAICHSSATCLCPLYRFGPGCFIEHPHCQEKKNPCLNNGICIPFDARHSPHNYTCSCASGFMGSKCGEIGNKIVLEFPDSLVETTSLIAIHLITAFPDKEHQRNTLIRKLPIDRNIISLDVAIPFHIIIIELAKHEYYEAVLREVYVPSESILVRIESNRRCPSINVLGNETWPNSSLGIRGKLYPFLCRNNRKLACFYDENQICICDQKRFANCFEFNHSMEYDCINDNLCQNNGQCLIRNAYCPSSILCICPDCFYGTKCQYSTSGFFISLEPILGYHIRPGVSLDEQSSSVQISILLSTIILLIGIISCSLSILTFQSAVSRQTGSGSYLLISSILSLCTLILLKVKVWYLILSQIGLIQSQVLLRILCITIEPATRMCQAGSAWLNVCVAIERAFIIRKGIGFDRTRSQKLAKRVILILILLIFLSFLHDPIHRQIVNDFDVEEKRTWCFVRFSPIVEQIDSAMVFIHSFLPIGINFIAVIHLIIFLAKSRMQTDPNISFQNKLRIELEQHKHLLLTPVAEILLNAPRIIVPFFTRCMKTPRNPTLFLVGYFLSYVPAMLTFLIFVVPSKQHMDNFRKALKRLKSKVLRRK